MTRYNYNRQMSPPAPFVHVQIGIPSNDSVTRELPAQLDCAADRTVIPWSVVEELTLPQLDELPVLGFGGHLTMAATFLIDLAVRGFPAVTVEVFGNRDEPFVILGCDVLNQFRAVLDGPHLVLELNMPQ